MAIKENRADSGANKLINFVPLLGGLYVINDKSADLIKQARAHAGAKQTDGYQGNTGETASAKALSFLKERGVNSVRLTGALTGVSFKEVPIEGKNEVIKKALVTLTDQGEDGINENYVLSLNLGSSATQMLVRKLENVKPGEEISVNMFGSFDTNDNKESPYFGKSFSNYGALVKLGSSFTDKEAEVKGNVSRTDELQKLVETTQTALTTAGVTDKATIGSAVNTKRLEYHVALTKELEQRFKNAMGDAPAPETGAEPGVDQVDESEAFEVQDLVGQNQGASEVRSAQQRMRA